MLLTPVLCVVYVTCFLLDWFSLFFCFTALTNLTSAPCLCFSESTLYQLHFSISVYKFSVFRDCCPYTTKGKRGGDFLNPSPSFNLQCSPLTSNVKGRSWVDFFIRIRNGVKYLVWMLWPVMCCHHCQKHVSEEDECCICGI